MYTCNKNFELQLQIAKRIYLQVHKISYVYLDFFLIFFKIPPPPTPTIVFLRAEVGLCLKIFVVDILG